MDGLLGGPGYYQHGPMSDWQGLCEVTTDGRYIYHSRWPERSVLPPHAFIGTSNEPTCWYVLDRLIRSGEWVSVLPADLTLTEGL